MLAFGDVLEEVGSLLWCFTTLTLAHTTLTSLLRSLYIADSDSALSLLRMLVNWTREFILIVVHLLLYSRY